MEYNRRSFLKQAGIGALELGLLNQIPLKGLGSPLMAGQLPRSTPESQGIQSGSLLAFINAVEKANLNLHSLMVLRHGNVVAEGWWAPYAPDLKHTLYSLSKSFTSSAIGFAVSEKRLSVEDKVVALFPAEVPAMISNNLAAMRVKDLLTMATGHDKDTTPAVREAKDPNWVKTFLAQPVEHQPGTHFVYNSGATYMLSAIIQKLTGKTLLEYLTPRLFAPLGISGMDWEVDPNGINTGGWGLRLKTEDIAKFGQLYLQKGSWKGKQILPQAWIEEATTAHIQSKGGSRPKADNDWLQGYGYQFWRCRHGAYRGDGAYGQYCIVIPDKNMVVAITSETSDMQGIMDQIWNHILPQADDKTVDKTLQNSLETRLSRLVLSPEAGNASSSLVSEISGKHFKMAENALGISDVSLHFSKELASLTIKDNAGEHAIHAGINKWKEGMTDMPVMPLKLVLTPVPGETKSKIAASGTWLNENTFEMTLRFIETAHYEKVKCTFDGTSLSVEFKRSLAILGNTKDARPVLKGVLYS
ncbi:serine hydrolase domain-containing protein [Dyadobacter helix]|nr:serine hydrolase [Dyadobacter sp. CECT 9275]